MRYVRKKYYILRNKMYISPCDFVCNWRILFRMLLESCKVHAKYTLYCWMWSIGGYSCSENFTPWIQKVLINKCYIRLSFRWPDITSIKCRLANFLIVITSVLWDLELVVIRRASSDNPGRLFCVTRNVSSVSLTVATITFEYYNYKIELHT